MKIITQKLFFFIIFLSAFNIFAQDTKELKKLFNIPITESNKQSLEETGYIRCGSYEYEKYLQEIDKNRATDEEFEAWMEANKDMVMANRLSSPNVVKTIPVIFHIFTDGSGADNVSAALIQAQVNQLNIDYRNLAGSPFTSAGDAQLQFCLAQQNPTGGQLTEPGINRITTYGEGPFSQSDFQTSMKSATQWDPTRYFNVWVAGLTDDLLGYAQFPSNSGLQGLNTSGGNADTDGVVVLNVSVGSVANPNPNGGIYGMGRTLTHESGHWLGLRHIWGDTTTCTNDDYCADTPDATTAHYQCSTYDTCPSDGLGNDMVQNYMDYTNDACMHTYTNNQVGRITTVMTLSPRRAELANSTVCQPAQIYNLDGKIDIGTLNLDNCGGKITPVLTITNKGNNTLTSATYSYFIDSNTPINGNWNGSLAYDQSANIALPQITVANGSHTFYVNLTNPNGGTDQNTSNNSTSSAFSITGTHCTSVANTTYETSTTGVIFNTISNLNTGKPSGYSNYTNLITNVNKGQSYNLSVYANSDGNYQIITYAWIDWNQNCSFDDAGEQYNLGTSANINNQLTSASPFAILVPTTALSGTTKMRITTKYTNPNANQYPTSCENDHDAEVEDYSVNVVATAGVKDHTFNQLQVYPNPSQGIFNVVLESNNTDEAVIELFDMRGRLINKVNLGNENSIQTQINLENITDGLYLMKINKGNENGVKQIIVQ